MTEPSQYFKGRTVQEQMDEVIGYVDKRAEEVAAAKADDVLQPAEAAKTAAQAAAQEAEAAKNATIAALPTIQQDISDLKAENVALDGRLNTVELKVQTAEGNIVTIQGQIVALQTADGQNVKINDVNQYAVGLTGNQFDIAGAKVFLGECTGTSYFGLTNKRASFAINDRSTKNRSWFRLLEDANSTTLISGFYDANDDGTNQVILSMNIVVGETTKTIEIVRVATDASGNVTLASVGGKAIS